MGGGTYFDDPLMLHELEPWLWVGADEDCALAQANQRIFQSWGGIVHATKYPCHAEALGYNGKTKLLPTHPEYLVAHRPGNLYANLIDPPVPLFKLEIFAPILDFIKESVGDGDRRCIIHCNAGLSRAPSLALLYLAKRAELLPNDSFAVAREAFLTKYPLYAPGAGLVMFLTERWGEIQ